MNQQKIFDSFRGVDFYPGQYLIKEGDIGDEAFLIKEGECSIESRRNPLSYAATKEFGNKKVDVSLRTQRGYLSKTLNTLQYGILQKNQWAGEERLIKSEEEPFDYSIIALTKVRAYAITKNDAKKKLPREIMLKIMKNVDQRIKWFSERAKSLITASIAVAKMDPSQEKYDEQLAIISKKYPAAMPSVLTNIRKKQFIHKSHFSLIQSPARLVPKEIKEEAKSKNIIKAKEESRSLLSIRSIGNLSPISNANKDKSINKSSMSNATSISEIVVKSPYIPVLNKSVSKPHLSNIASFGLATINKRNNIEEAYIKKVASKEIQRISVGRREIKLLKNENDDRVNTPNPFFILTNNAGVKH